MHNWSHPISTHVLLPCAGGARVLQVNGTTRDVFYYPSDTVSVRVVGSDIRPGENLLFLSSHLRSCRRTSQMPSMRQAETGFTRAAARTQHDWCFLCLPHLVDQAIRSSLLDLCLLSLSTKRCSES